MRFNRQDHDLAQAFVQMVLCQALAKNKPSPALLHAKHLVDDGLALPIVQRCMRDSWTDAVMAWKGSGHIVTDRDQFRRDVRKAAGGDRHDRRLSVCVVRCGWNHDARRSLGFRSPRVEREYEQTPFCSTLCRYSPTLSDLRLTLVGRLRLISTAEAQWVLVTKMGFTGTQTVPSKAHRAITVTDDLLRMGAELAVNFLSAELRNAIACARRMR